MKNQIVKLYTQIYSNFYRNFYTNTYRDFDCNISGTSVTSPMSTLNRRSQFLWWWMSNVDHSI